MLNKGRLFFILLIIVSLQSLMSEKCFAFGKTWLGKGLEWQINNAGFSLGPFRIKTQFVLSNVGFDSNIYYGATDEPVKDYTFTTGPAFNIYLPLKKKVIFHIYESPQYVYFKQTEQERTWNNYFMGEAYFVFNRFVISCGVGRSEAKQRWNTETDIPIFRKEDSVQSSMFWQPAARTSFTLGFRMDRFNYGESTVRAFGFADKLNRNETFYSFSAYRDITLRTRFFMDAEYGYFEFANPLLSKNSKSYRGSVGLDFSPFAKLRGRVKVGYKLFDSLNPQRKDYKGIVSDSSVSVRLLRALSARASYRRDVQFSVWSNNTYFLENWYGAGASLYLTRNIRLDYDYNRGKNDYPQEFSAQKRRDNYQIHALGLYLRVRKNTAFGVIASRWVRDSTLDWAKNDRDFVGFNLTYDF